MHDNFRPVISIAEFDLTSIAEEFSIAEPTLPWAPQYGHYQNGGWYTCTIMNHSGVSTDNVIADGTASPTELMAFFPKLTEYIAASGLSVMWARLAKMNAAAALWEHVDYTELSKTERYRLHIPIRTNDDAALIFPGQAIHLSPGYIWLIDPHSNRHAAVNRGNTSRVHLLLDVYSNRKLEELIEQAARLDYPTIALPKIQSHQRSDLLDRALRLVSLGFTTTADELLLSSFLHYDLSEESSYDLLIELYSASELKPQRNYWQERKDIHLGTTR
ncbi:hypothetical protein BH10CYA1_BH10CYA1_55760 [soil metagenome]